MAIATSTIRKENIFARHSSGAIVTPTSVTDLGGGSYQYKLDRNWTEADTGEWGVFTSSTYPVLSAAGAGVPERKIGAFTVAIASQWTFIIVVPWTSLFTASIYRVGSTPPDFSDADWQIWHQYTRNPIAWTWESRINYRVGQTAIEHSVRSGALNPATHANAVPRGGNVWSNLLPGGAEIVYSPVHQSYVNEFILPAGAYKRIGWKAFSDAAGTIEINGLNGASDIMPDETRRNQGIPFTPPTVLAIRFYLTKADNAIVEYLMPLS